MSEHIVPIDECPLTHLQVDDVTWRCLTPEQRALLQEVTDTLLAADDLHISPESGAITPAGNPAAGQRLQLRVYRKAADGGDTLDADALLAGITITYTRE